jgi:type I restriction enzyme S subunit
MTAIKNRKLGSVISVSKGRKHLVVETPSSSSKRLLGIDDLRNDNLLRYTDDPAGTTVQPEDVLIAWDGANAGTIGFGKSGYIGSTIARLRVGEKEKIFTPFLGMFLKSKFNHLRQTSTGATIPHINRKALDDIELPDFDFNDQIRISHLLGKVEGLIVQRKQHLQLLNDLLKSVFLEIFGFQDGIYNQWPIEKLAFYTEVVSGVTKGKKYTTEKLIDAPYLRVANVQDGHFNLEEIKTIAVNQKEIDQYQLRRGDLLLTEGGDPDKLGRGSVWEEQVPNCIHQNHIFRVRIKEQAEINPYYLSALVGSSYGKAYFLKSAKQTTGIASINSTQLKNFPTVIPPIDLQNRFATIVEKIEGIKFHYQQSLTHLEALYGALSQKSFKGELDLSRVPMPTSVQVIAPTELDDQQTEKKPTDQVIALTVEPFNSSVFEDYLRARAGKVYSTQSLWEELQQVNYENPPPNFEAFKELILRYLERDGWFDQIYENDGAKHKTNVDERRVCLRIRNDS